MGDQFTSADILLTTCLDWAIAYGVGICDNAHPYLGRIQRRPAYQLAKAANVPPVAGHSCAEQGLTPEASNAKPGAWPRRPP